tara:strand:+ start:20163 stop:20951 length:789 start_codon:yes stop_codon:yes gene_type:complete
MSGAVDAPPVSLRNLPFQLDEGVASRAGIGLIVLASDQSMEREFADILALDGVTVFHSRILNDNEITPETLARMEQRLAPTADLLLPGVDLDVMAFGCTSASMVIGEDRVAERIREARPGIAVTTPITAAFAAFRALQCNRIGLLTPYRDDVNLHIREYVQARGFTVPVMASFNEPDDRKVARIRIEDVQRAAIELGRREDVDSVFISCTNVRAASVIGDIEAEIGKPVTSSNHAMAWHCLRLSGVADRLPGWGSLFERGLT